MKVTAIVQARMGSLRMPGKVLADLCGHPALWHIYDRVSHCQRIQSFVIATTKEKSDDAIEAFAAQNRISVFRGSEQNVLERFYFAAREEKAEIVVRLTGDNVLISPQIIDAGVKYFERRPDLDYLYYREGLPVGMAVEILSFRALAYAYQQATDAECLEHVTPFLYRNPDRFRCFRCPAAGADYSKIRWTMDTPQDYTLIKQMYQKLYTEERCFSYEEALRVYRENETWSTVNQSVRQKEIRYRGEADPSIWE